MSIQKKTAASAPASATPRLEGMRLRELLAMAHKKNPKEHDLPALIGSFVRFGFIAFPTIDESTQVMVAGHGRCEALEMMRISGAPPPRNVTVLDDGDWLVPVVRGVAFESERQRDAYVIADNQHTIHGGWNLDRLGELVTELRLDGFEGMGFSAIELDNLLGQYEAGKDAGAGDKSKPPEEDGKFVRHDIQVETTYQCPKCGYEWSGKPK